MNPITNRGKIPGITFRDTSVPVGGVIQFLGNIGPQSPPSNNTTDPIEAWGWMVCDGRQLSVVDYPELYAALGYLYGGQDDTFVIPDLSGMFLRGITTSPAAIEDRTAAQNGTTNGIGSTQMHALQTHVHSYSKAEQTGVGGTDNTVALAVPNQDTGTPATSPGAEGSVNVSAYETRPSNTFAYYLIKYTYKVFRGIPHY